jgi:GNAT superfamily N-acetyltransferase
VPGGDPAVRLRPATEADVPTLLELIRGIAEYERLAHEVEATEALLRRHGFGPRPVFEAILAERPGAAGPRAVGFALYFFSFSTFRGRPTLYLEDLFVRPEERGRGTGRRLLAELARIAVGRECGRMEWSVLDWNAPARDFYFKLGARAMDEWTVFRMTPEAFERLAREGAGGDPPDEAV